MFITVLVRMTAYMTYYVLWRKTCLQEWHLKLYSHLYSKILISNIKSCIINSFWEYPKIYFFIGKKIELSLQGSLAMCCILDVSFCIIIK